MSENNYEPTSVGKNADKVDSQIENLIVRRRRYLLIVTALLDDCENKLHIVPSDETRYLFPMMNLWKNHELNRWLCTARVGDFSEKHFLQVIGWMYDHMVLLNGVSKTDIARCLLASRCLRDNRTVEAVRTGLSRRLPNRIETILRNIVTLNPVIR